MSNNYLLTLDSSNSITLALDWGCNMFSWICQGSEIMFCPPDYPRAAWKITGGGNPLLFPSVGRTYDFTGQEPVLGRYTIYGDDTCYDMITHGLLYVCKWELVDKQKSQDNASATFRALFSDEIKNNRYPFDVDFRQTYTLYADRVELCSQITNVSDKTIPAAFGYHPYFRISNNTREGISVDLPVKRHLFVNSLTQLSGESQPCASHYDLKKGVYYDDAYDTLTDSRMTLTDAQAGRKIHVDFDPKFELLFLYSPDDSDFVCIEPWTKGMGAYATLKDPGWESGVNIPVVGPNEAVNYKASFIVEKY